jgi:hypothetical protein
MWSGGLSGVGLVLVDWVVGGCWVCGVC